MILCEKTEEEFEEELEEECCRDDESGREDS